MRCLAGTEPVFICNLPRVYSDMNVGICTLCNRRLTRGVRRRRGVHTATPSLQRYCRINTEQCLHLWTGSVYRVRRSYCWKHLLHSAGLLEEIWSRECACNSNQTANQTPVMWLFINRGLCNFHLGQCCWNFCTEYCKEICSYNHALTTKKAPNLKSILAGLCTFYVEGKAVTALADHTGRAV